MSRTSRSGWRWRVPGGMMSRMSDITDTPAESEPAPAVLPAGLYLVGTPIGNLEDITARALRILGGVSVVFAEDTRITRRLLERYAIRTPMISCHQHNEARRIETILERVRRGEAVALATDAGMPGVSDPGSRVAEAVRAEGLPVTVIPGPCSVSAALALSGLGGGAYSFSAFLPHKSGARRKRLASLLERAEPVVLFESPYRIAKLAGELAELDPERPVCMARELTKKFEEVRTLSAREWVAYWDGRTPRGEFVVIIAPREAGESRDDEPRDDSHP